MSIGSFGANRVLPASDLIDDQVEKARGSTGFAGHGIYSTEKYQTNSKQSEIHTYISVCKTNCYIDLSNPKSYAHLIQRRFAGGMHVRISGVVTEADCLGSLSTADSLKTKPVCCSINCYVYETSVN